MSFILEALKKSEQQRQEQKAAQSKVHKQTLSLTSGQSDRRSYWLLVALVPLLLLGGWWFFSGTESPEVPPAAVSRTLPEAAAISPVVVPEAVVSPPAVVSAPQPPVVVVESAPVPRDMVSSPTGSTITTSGQIDAPSTEPRPAEVFIPRETVTSDQPVAKRREVQQPALPLYLDLSMELRDRMPAMAMSMHYYTAVPARRMVRINNRLLHEGDWVNDDLEVVEITPSGAVLDFLGKSFELRSAGR